ncbi:MAG: hypothetical protein SP1CHLAM54_01850 [Chlamydiia bacterium]|nr:hypothetical protein [Chlamydiia bacterium]MCH9615103.1 hypothetical protein [Chlamydiia bacterium]MCH9628575.1 hypothetical protein [Chlamydiia bacterium]
MRSLSLEVLGLLPDLTGKRVLEIKTPELADVDGKYDFILVHKGCNILPEIVEKHLTVSGKAAFLLSGTCSVKTNLKPLSVKQLLTPLYQEALPAEFLVIYEKVPRQTAKRFWGTREADLNSMVLKTDGEAYSLVEIPEILSIVDPYIQKRVLELGAGIGRFTGELAKLAENVVCNDFVEKFLDTNKNVHGHLSNITYLCQDVCNLCFKKNSFDFIFSNWLFFYLDDTRAEELLKKMKGWLAPGGVCFIRESCRESRQNPTHLNPSTYREAKEYEDFVKKEFEIIGRGLIRSYPEKNQHFWLFKAK